MKTGGTRKERDEIAALKSQLASVTEELKQKESRYGASQARQRNQIRSLEKEVAALKADNEQLRKLNGKLQAQLKAENRRSQPPSDTKVGSTESARITEKRFIRKSFLAKFRTIFVTIVFREIRSVEEIRKRIYRRWRLICDFEHRNSETLRITEKRFE